MSRIFVNIAMSLDGYLAPEGMALAHWQDPTYKNWGAKWGSLMAWVLETEHFRTKLKFGGGGVTGPVNDHVAETFARIGANVMGKRMFEQGEVSWPEEAPFHNDVFVVTHTPRAPWVRPGGTTFHFVTDGVDAAVARARAAAGDKDVRIAGGADLIQQCLAKGIVDELEIALAPVFFGAGRRLFDNLGDPVPHYRIDRVLPGPNATHLRYVRA